MFYRLVRAAISRLRDALQQYYGDKDNHEDPIQLSIKPGGYAVQIEELGQVSARGKAALRGEGGGELPTISVATLERLLVGLCGVKGNWPEGPNAVFSRWAKLSDRVTEEVLRAGDPDLDSFFKRSPGFKLTSEEVHNIAELLKISPLLFDSLLPQPIDSGHLVLHLKSFLPVGGSRKCVYRSEQGGSIA